MKTWWEGGEGEIEEGNDEGGVGRGWMRKKGSNSMKKAVLLLAIYYLMMVVVHQT